MAPLNIRTEPTLGVRGSVVGEGGLAFSVLFCSLISDRSRDKKRSALELLEMEETREDGWYLS